MTASPMALCRETCSSFRTDRVRIDSAALHEFEKLLPPSATLEAAYSGACATNRFPELSFESPKHEAGFLALVHALNFGSGFRPQLHRVRDGQGAWLTMRAGMVRLGQLSTAITPEFLKSIDAEAVDRLFDLRGHPDLRSLRDFIAATLEDLATGLHAAGAASMAEFVFRSHTASELVSALVSTFPRTFDDVYEIEGQRVALYKKAQLVASELVLRAADEPALRQLQFPDFADLTAFVDNVVVAVLRHAGVLRCVDEITRRIEAEEPLHRGEEDEVALRAKALHAIELIVAARRARISETDAETSSITAVATCNYLWGVCGKSPELRRVHRHLTPSTLFY